MRSLREDERDEIEAVKHLVKYTFTKPNIEDFEIWRAITEMEKMARKYVLSEIVTENELKELTDLQSMILRHLTEKESK